MMKLKIQNTQKLKLKSAKQTGNARAKCWIIYDGKEQQLDISINPSPQKMQSDDCKVEAKLAFALAAKIAKHFLDIECREDDFKLPKGAHMVIYKDCNSYGDNAEQSKGRVKNGLSEIATVEFYLRHSLLAIEHESHGTKREQKASILAI